jgi:3-oxoacyl-[acyl-carrier protein] reductase
MKQRGYAILTGGSRGIGEGYLIQLAKEGYDVIVNYVSDSSTEKAVSLSDRMKKLYGIDAIPVQADVSDYAQCKKLVDAAVANFGENISVLVNNAGITLGKSYTNVTYEEYSRLIGINLFGVLNCTHLVLPYMVKQNYGCIVSTSSIGGLVGLPNQVDYCAAKGGILGFTKALAKEVGQFNIRVNSIAPGRIATDLMRSVNVNVSLTEKAKKDTPLGILGDYDDMGQVLSYIINAKFLTGQTISPNGGMVIY